MPLGRLRALCQRDYFRSQSPRDAVEAVLAKKPGYNAVTIYDLDILAVRGMSNTVFSPLCRLPDEVLVHIMDHLDWLDMLCIRRTSRIFLRLLWTRMEKRLRGGSHDPPCERFYTGIKNVYMHCSACEVDHPISFFSAAQRREKAGGHRVCVAHEGHVRLCEHKTVKLAEVLRSLPGGRINNHYPHSNYAASLATPRGP
ncbi:f-box domain containing protein [Niveomyces insectorum RCEF 264]|uniref:F-box domain containing protein n=1 Tax=Niveomyces insectorum RCEF 264 TaxID=1081102 RepID=A0A167P543_9HYPO|nr:f-box domain containing protein [Niveomyces insectorum RCEF 264]